MANVSYNNSSMEIGNDWHKNGQIQHKRIDKYNMSI